MIVEGNGTGTELWRSNGTSAGTYLVKDVNPGGLSSGAQFLTAVEETLFFTADDGSNGGELWRSNGLDTDTLMVKDILVGNASGGPRALFNMNGLLVFLAPTPASSQTVFWVSNGTADGTTPFNSLAISSADNFRTLGNKLIFAAENATVGRELFVFTLDVTPAVPVLTSPGAVTSELRPVFSWTAVAGATQYEIWIKNQSTGEDRLIVEAVSATSFTPAFDPGIGNFSVWIRTLGNNGAPNSPWGPQRNFRIKVPVTQNTVTVNPSNGQPTISWQALPGAAKYDVWIDRLDVPTSQIVRDMNVTGTSLTPTTLPRGSYRVWVRGLAADGADGAWSASQDFTTVPVPIITSGLNPTFDTTPTISWTAVAGASAYEVYVLSINGNSKALHQKNISGTSFTWPVLPVGPYRYWVRVSGATVWSSPVEIDTTGRTDVLGPTGTTTDRTPTISWRPVDGAVRYELWVNRLGVQDKIIYQTNLTTTTFTPTSNLATGNYRVWVRAVSGSATAPWSAYVDFMIADALIPNSLPGDLDLLASVFSDSRLLPVLGEGPAFVVAVRTASAIPVVPREDPERVPIENPRAKTRPGVDARSCLQV